MRRNIFQNAKAGTGNTEQQTCRGENQTIGVQNTHHMIA
jgi:hypothetical protein